MARGEIIRTIQSTPPRSNRVSAGGWDSPDETKIVPRSELVDSDFKEVWWIGDYSDVNTGEDAGFLAVHLLNALNQSGFQITSSKNAKGQMAFEFHGHYSIDDPTEVPFEIHCQAGEASGTTT